MTKKLKFTAHAKRQMADRGVEMTEEALIEALSNGRSYPLGYESRKGKSQTRMHRLFVDTVGRHFVAVIDERTGDILTILHADYDGKCRLPLNAVDALGQMDKILPIAVAPPLPVSDPKKCHILLFTNTSIGSKLLTIRTKIPFSVGWPDDPVALSEDKTFQTSVRDAVSRLTAGRQNLVQIAVRIGNKGKYVNFPMHYLD